MNEQFRVAQKIGLMFRPGTAIPKDIKAWAISQLHANSPALGVSGKSGEVKPYPKSLEPSLEQRVQLSNKYNIELRWNLPVPGQINCIISNKLNAFEIFRKFTNVW